MYGENFTINVHDMIKNGGGTIFFTSNPKRYIVAYMGAIIPRFDELDTEVLDSELLVHLSQIFANGNFLNGEGIGFWTFARNLFIDVIKTSDDLEEAMSLASENDEDAIYDSLEQKEIQVI
jgi:hypothetical protein